MECRGPQSVSWLVPLYKVCLKLHSWRTLNLMYRYLQETSKFYQIFASHCTKLTACPSTSVPQNTQIIWNRWITMMPKTGHTAAHTCSHLLTLAHLHLFALSPTGWLVCTCSHWLTRLHLLGLTCSYLLKLTSTDFKFSKSVRLGSHWFLSFRVTSGPQAIGFLVVE